MPKIGTGRYRHEQSYGEYPIFYNSNDKIFYTKISSLFPGAEGFFDSIIEQNTELKGIGHAHINRLGFINIAFGKTEAELIENVSAFHKKFVTQVTTETKVILYNFDYTTETQKKSIPGMCYGDGGGDRLEMTFKYIIAKKRMFGEDKLYTYENGNSIASYNVREFKEIAWSQELEDFIKLFSKSFDDLINKMKPFFEIDGKIIELIGKNILNQ